MSLQATVDALVSEYLQGVPVDLHDFTPGARVMLVFCSDPYTRLKHGDLGTVRRAIASTAGDVVHIDWDDGSTLAMLPAEGDLIRIVEPELELSPTETWMEHKGWI